VQSGDENSLRSPQMMSQPPSLSRRACAACRRHTQDESRCPIAAMIADGRAALYGTALDQRRDRAFATRQASGP
jgi:hypothetical protein